MDIGLALCLGAAVAAAAYSGFLHTIQHLYQHDWTWVTVVGGNALIGGFFAAWLYLAGEPLTDFWRLLALNVAAGLPVIAWQIGQRDWRREHQANGRRLRRPPDRKDTPSHESTPTRRPPAD